MSSKNIKEIKKDLLKVEKERSRILAELLSVRSMLRGSYAVVLTKCGKDTCRCKEGKGHPHARITWTEKGKGTTRKVPSDQIPWVQDVTENYQHFRSLRRKLVRLEAKSKKLFDDVENDLIQRTREGIDFLGTIPRNRNKKEQLVPKTKK